MLEEFHGLKGDDFHKIAIGVGFYGRSHGGVYESNPAKLPDASCSGKGSGGTIEDGTFSYYDLYKNYIGPEGKGINGFEAYHYPEFGADLLYSKSKNMVIGYTSPESVSEIMDIILERKLKGVFTWEMDDDNGMLQEAML